MNYLAILGVLVVVVVGVGIGYEVSDRDTIACKAKVSSEWAEAIENRQNAESLLKEARLSLLKLENCLEFCEDSGIASEKELYSKIKEARQLMFTRAADRTAAQVQESLVVERQDTACHKNGG